VKSLLSIVVNYHTDDLLARFLESYKEHVEAPSRDLIVVDVEGDGTNWVDWLSADGPECLYWDIEAENIGYATACNRNATGKEYRNYAFFNADTVFLDRGCVDSCIDLLESNDDVAVVGPMQVNSSGKVTHAGIFGTNTHPIHRAWMDNYPDQYEDIRDAVTVSGSAYFVDAAVWNEMIDCVGYGLLPSKLYHEETWFSYHVREHGYRVLYNGEAKMIHEWHKSVEKNQTWADIAYKESELMFKQACADHGIEHNIA
jgi:GT2 family glycosyltransferase